MKIETLKAKIDNTEKKIIKVEGTLERHNNRLNKIKEGLINKNINLKSYDKYNDLVRDNDLYWELCDYERKLEDINSNENKLNDLKDTLEKLKNKLAVEVKKKNDIDNVIPKCLIEFLERWKQRTKEYFINLSNEYIDLKFKEYEVTKEELEKLYIEKYNHKSNKYEIERRYSDEEIIEVLASEYKKHNAESYIRNRYLKKFKNKHFANNIAIADKIINYNEIKLDILENILNLEVQAKKESFVMRVEEVVGVIEDMSDFRIGNNGEINGIAIGNKCKAKVETIIAGGYNIQCLHFRVLVNKIK